MKLFNLIIFLFVVNPIVGICQNMISPFYYQNNELKKFNNDIADSSEITINMVEKCPTGYWEVAVLRNGKYDNIRLIDNKGKSCKFRPLEVNWYQASRLYDINSDCDLYKVRIQYITTDTTEIKYIYLSLLPSRPRFSNVLYKYSYNWDCDFMDVGAEFSFDVHSKNAEWFTLLESYSHSFLDDYIFFGIMEDFELSEKMHFCYDEDWGTFFSLRAYNQFGYVYGDTICTTSYITDEAIIKRLQELKTTGITDLYHKIDPACDFLYKNHIIIFSTVIKSIKLYDITGKMSLSAQNAKSIDISHLTTGLYIIKYLDIDNIIKTNKIIIK